MYADGEKGLSRCPDITDTAPPTVILAHLLGLFGHVTYVVAVTSLVTHFHPSNDSLPVLCCGPADYNTD